VARALGRDECHGDVRRRLDLAVVHGEAVAEEQHVALGDALGDRALVDLAVQLVGRQDHDEIALRGGLRHAGDLQARALRLLNRRGALAQAYDDVHTGVLEVQRVGMALGAVADDGHGLALQETEIGVVVVEHGARL
jgi:hypothetical protein